MKLEKAVVSRVTELASGAGPLDEIEARYTQILPLEKFDAAVNYFRMHGREFKEEDKIDVSVQLDGKMYRVTASGSADVASVLSTVTSKTVVAPSVRPRLTCIIKSLTQSITVSDYHMKITKKQEVPVTSKEVLVQIAERLGSNARLVRTKRRFSCLSDDGTCRFDLTAVNHVNLAAGMASTKSPSSSLSQVRYEAEVEVMNPAEGDITGKVLKLFKCFSIILKLVHATDYILSKDQQQGILARMYALTKAPGKFIGPKPVTLELRHLAAPAVASGGDSIRENYTITDKADGERALVFIDDTGQVYIIDDRLNVKSTGLLAHSSSSFRSLLDCEVVTNHESKLRFLACFDAYFHGGQDLRKLPLILRPTLDAEDRLSHLKAILREASCTQKQPSDPIIIAKEFRMVQFGGDDLFNQVRYLVRKKEAGELPYDTDGLIFTPSTLAVGASEAGQSSVTFTGGTWSKVYKWKPPEYNSIDFLLKFTDDLVVKVNTVYRRAQLFVGTKASSKPVTLMDYIAYLHKAFHGSLAGQGAADVKAHSNNSGNEYVPRLFEAANTNGLHSCLLRMTDGVCRCENGDVINDGTIVEMTYKCPSEEQQHHEPACWQPLRVRLDKTERYRASNSISGAANDINTALSVWRSICFPIHLNMLTGASQVSEKELQVAVNAAAGNLYYIRNRPREQSASLPMLIFHNAWVKRACLIQRFKGHAHSLVDFGCGRGGDIKKWAGASFLRVLGIEPVDDNLTNPGPVNEGACVRAMNEHARSQMPRFPKIVFLRMDASQVINDKYIQALHTTDPESSTIAKSLWAMDDMASMPPELRSLHGFAVNGFDVASCMFAVHYFFDKAQRLDAFASNVANQLRPGGFFIGTCLDGERVRQALAGVKYGGSIEGRKDGQLLWSMTRLYRDDDLQKQDAMRKGLQDATQLGRKKPKTMKKKTKVVTNNVHKGGAAQEQEQEEMEQMDVDEHDPRLNACIRVFVETIGQPLDEYLVDYGLLREVLEAKGVREINALEAKKLGFSGSSGTFDDLYSKMAIQVKDADPKDAQSIKLAMQMSDAEKQYSFMHRWFVFKKK